MKRFLIAGLVAGLMFLALPQPAQASQVFCRVPTLHKVVCYNYTPYRVWMNVTVRTAWGPRYFGFWNYYNHWTKFIVPVVYSVSWRWHY